MTAVAYHARDTVSPHRGTLLLVCALVLGAIPAVMGSAVIELGAGLYSLAGSENPYFVPEHALFLYVVAPVVVMSAFVLLMTPGLLLSISLGAAKSVGQWLVSALALSIVMVGVGCEVVEAIIGGPLRGTAFVSLVMGCSAIAGVVLLRACRSSKTSLLTIGPHERYTVAALFVVTWVLLAVLTPKIYWENFNGDGVHAFEASRLLLWQAIPFWQPGAGDIGGFPGFSSALFTYPNAWFIRLFGEVEAVVRVPFFLYLGILYAVIVSLAEVGGERALSTVERLLVWVGPIVYAVVMAFSATYNPYIADIALPAVQDTLMMVFFFGLVLSFLRQEHGWTCVYVVLTYLSSPGGLILIAGWLFAVTVIQRPIPWRQIAFVVAGVAGCLVLGIGLGGLLAWMGLPTPGGEYGFQNLARKLSLIQLGHWQRIAFVVIPCGIVPAVALLWWKRQDGIARTFTVFTATVFLFYYFQAYVSLHYFVPVMLAPVVVLWHHEAFRDGRYRVAAQAAIGVGGVVALFVALPGSTYIDETGRNVGGTIEDRVDGYEEMDVTAFKRADLLYTLFPFKINPANGYVGSPLVWYYYARRGQHARDQSEVNYVIGPVAEPPPGTTLVADDQGIGLYVRDQKVWEDHRSLRPPSPPGSPFLSIDRPMLFFGSYMEHGPKVINLRQLARHVL